MSNRLTIVMSGRKQSGKSSACKYLFTTFINKKIGKPRFTLIQQGKEVLVFDTFQNKIVDVDKPNIEAQKLFDTYSIKIYSFADPLKQFCINIFGLNPLQCYGDDDNKDSNTHLKWTSIPLELRRSFKKKNKSAKTTGYITGRQLMQVFGTEICRHLDEHCWARGLYNSIKNDGYEIALVTDARFPNEISIGTEHGAKVIRLLRRVSNDSHESEIALDDFPLGEYSAVIDNQNLSMEQTHALLYKLPFIHWTK